MDLRIEHHRAYWAGFIFFFVTGVTLMGIGFGPAESVTLMVVGGVFMGVSLYFLPDGLRYFTLPREIEGKRVQDKIQAIWEARTIDEDLGKLLTEGAALAGAHADKPETGTPLLVRFAAWDAAVQETLEVAGESTLTFKSFTVKRGTKVRPEIPYRDWSWTLDCLDLKMNELRKCVERIHSRRNVTN